MKRSFPGGAGDENQPKTKARTISKSELAASTTSIELPDVPAVEELTSASLRKMILTFEKKLTTNQKLRVKFADAPEK